MTTIPRAQATGRLKVVTHATVTSIEVDGEGRATGVNYLADKTEYFQPAKVVLLASYTYENVRLLLLSRSKAFPKGLANNHGQVGRHYLSHHQGAGVSALFPYDLKAWYGLPAQGVAVDDWADDNFDHATLDFIGGGNLWLMSDRRPITASGMNTYGMAPAWGSQWKAFIKENADRSHNSYIQKTTLPYEDNYLDLDPEVKDPLGFPVIRITAEYKENERNIAAFCQDKMEQWYRAAGAVAIQRAPVGGAMGASTHAYGGTRMGDSVDTNVVESLGVRARSAEPRDPRRIRHGHERRAQPDAYGPGALVADRRASGEELEEHRREISDFKISDLGFRRETMIPRRQVLGGALAGGVLGALAEPEVEAAAQSSDRVDVAPIVRALNDLRSEVRTQRQFAEIATHPRSAADVSPRRTASCPITSRSAPSTGSPRTTGTSAGSSRSTSAATPAAGSRWSCWRRCSSFGPTRSANYMSLPYDNRGMRSLNRHFSSSHLKLAAIVDVAASRVARDLRVRAERTRAIHLAVDGVRGDDTRRRDAALHPILQRREHVERVRAGPAAAVVHSGHEVRPQERRRLRARRRPPSSPSRGNPASRTR